MDDKERRVALLRVGAALDGSPQPPRALRRAAARTARKPGSPRRRTAQT